MTYRQLLTNLRVLSEVELDMNVTIYNPQMDEFSGCEWKINDENDDNGDVLDHNHPYLRIES